MSRFLKKTAFDETDLIVGEERRIFREAKTLEKCFDAAGHGVSPQADEPAITHHVGGEDCGESAVNPLFHHGGVLRP